MKRLALLFVIAGGCQGRTEIVIGVATDLRAKGQIDRATLIASRNGTPLVSTDWPLSDVPAGQYELPGSIGLYSADGSEPQVQLSLTGYLGNDVIADREAVLSLVSGQTLFARMTITSLCDPKVAPSCAADESCVEGVCQKRALDAHRLPKYRADLVTSTECDGAAHYIVSSTGMPMGSLGAVCPPGDECHEGTCWSPPKLAGSSGHPDLSFCLAVDLGFPDGGEQVVTSSDFRIADLPISVGTLFCGYHFYPNEITVNTNDGLQFTAVDGQSHHLMTPTVTTSDIKSQPMSILFPTAGDYAVTCTDHPTAPPLSVHVVN